LKSEKNGALKRERQTEKHNKEREREIGVAKREKYAY
jgi:hypothetical protein